MLSDLFNEIYQSNNYSILDTLLELKELKSVSIDEDYIYNLNEFITKVAIDHDLCPNCLTRLLSKVVVDNTHEYMGANVDEQHTVLYCELCEMEL
jgi:uncharacterized protein with PIN domain